MHGTTQHRLKLLGLILFTGASEGVTEGVKIRARILKDALVTPPLYIFQEMLIAEACIILANMLLAWKYQPRTLLLHLLSLEMGLSLHMWSSKSFNGLAIYKVKTVPSFLSYLKDPQHWSCPANDTYDILLCSQAFYKLS